MEPDDCHRITAPEKGSDLPAPTFQHLHAYRVDDLVVDKRRLRLALLLESPHQAEIRHGHPLAGPSGISAAKFLIAHVSRFYGWDPAAPLGCQMTARRETRLGLMNCVNYPLARSVYRPEDVEPVPDLVDGLDLIRRSPGAPRRKKPYVRQLEHDLIRDLEKRLAALSESALVVPCGEAARRFLEKCGMPRIRRFPEKVPHPSRNQWFWEKRFKKKDDFIRILNERL